MAKKHRVFQLNKVGNHLADIKSTFQVDLDTMTLNTRLATYQLVKHKSLNYWHCIANGFKVQVMIKAGTGVLHTWF
jgi:hypothetical protein